VYAVTGKGELVTLDGKTSQVTSRVKVDPSEPKHYFLNIALNTTKGVGFIADTNTADVLVVQLDSGKLVHRVPTPNSIAAVYNPRATKCTLPIAMPVRLALSMPTLTA
jgi:hypothetical protein